jgi:hypothetical protein
MPDPDVEPAAEEAPPIKRLTRRGLAAARRVPAIALVALASVVLFLGSFAVWVKRQALETDNWATTSSKLLEDEEIRNAVADFLVNRLYAKVDVQQKLATALPKELKPLAGPASGGLRQLATQVAQRALEQPRVQAIWEQANRNAHEQLLAIIDDRSTVVSTQGEEVSLDLGAVLRQLSAQTGIGENLAGKIPLDAARIEILKADELEEAQDGVRLLRTLAWVLSVVALALYGLAIYVATGKRRETLRAVGISFAAVGILLLFARHLAGDAVVGALASTAASEPAAQATWSIGTSMLVEIAHALIAYGVAIVAGAWLAGPSVAATGLRRGITPYIRQPRIAYGGLAIGVVLLLWWGPTEALRRPIPALILIALLAFGLETLRRQVVVEFPDRVTTASTAGIAQRLATRMREAPARRPFGRPGSPSPGGDERLDKLERLARLREAGVLDDAELAREKQRILGAES